MNTNPPPADEARRTALSLAAVTAAAAGVPDDENTALAALDEAALAEVAGPPAAVAAGDALWRGHNARPRALSLFDAPDEAGRVPLGWDPWRDTPILWDPVGHLAVHTDLPDRLDEGADAVTSVAVHLVRLHGPQAVTLVDADPAANPADPADRDAARRTWAPLVDAGVAVHPLAADLGHAAGAVATVAGAALARPYPTGDEAPRFLVIRHADHLVPTLEAAGEHAYAAAARDALRIIRAHGAARRVHLVASHAGDPARTRDPLASLAAYDSGDWSFMASYTDVPAEVFAGPPSPRVVLPGYVAPAWWADRLADRP